MRARIEQVDPHHEAHIYEESMTDLHAVADHCKALSSAGLTGDKEMRHLATIPGILIQQYCNDNGVTFAQFMRQPEHANRMLNDPALSAFRIHKGRV
jgi:hypothetical protein